MAQTKHEIQALLAGAGAEPRQRFGQNFMIDQNLVRLVANAGEIAAGDVVIEVGPGTGTLTEELLSRGAGRVVEVADRLRAKAGSAGYGPLSVMAQMLAEVEYLRKLPPGAFWPAPKVDSALVRMRRRDRLGARAGAFSTFVHQILSARRKTLRKA